MDPESLPSRVVEALRASEPQPTVPPQLDAAILASARIAIRRRARSRWIIRAVVASGAAAAVVAIGFRWSTHPDRQPQVAFVREDLNRDGRVDILDAFYLARKLDAAGAPDKSQDVNGDGKVDRSDVDAIAAAAVRVSTVGGGAS